MGVGVSPGSGVGLGDGEGEGEGLGLGSAVSGVLWSGNFLLKMFVILRLRFSIARVKFAERSAQPCTSAALRSRKPCTMLSRISTNTARIPVVSPVSPPGSGVGVGSVPGSGVGVGAGEGGTAWAFRR